MRKRIRFYPSGAEVNEQEIVGTTAAVADVLRATSTIVTALGNGCKAVIPATDIKTALAAVRSFRRQDVLLGGERMGRKIDGFDFGNSPQEYTRERVEDKVIVITTTNGTKALVYAQTAVRTVVLSFLNLTAIADFILQQERDVSVIAAGNDGDDSIEDTVCCGLLIDQLVRRAPGQFQPCQASPRAAQLAVAQQGKIQQLLRQSPHGEYLTSIGYESDLTLCADMDSRSIVPHYSHGRITII
ncbi:2-phosphosulfolactate phosphatase [candidate division KSB1 bacterium]|nr:2-phosphosulfolactate phosphatase [candidate division KSB1 bacterium]RQW07542.1 MAG: 2-phosphosulfolactate phosphatase [candidate division KSB1 bacterium]